jgi:hypothetical protein
MPQANSVGREFVFCISCARLVENVAPRSAKLCRRILSRTKNDGHSAGEDRSLGYCGTTVSHNAQVIILFLNCTKNTELT